MGFEAALEEALGAATEEAGEAGQPDTTAEAAPVQPQEATTAQQETQAQPEPSEPTAAPGQPTPPALTKAPAPAGPQQSQAQQQAPEPRAPTSWRAVVREQWASLPRPVKDEILKREGEMSRALQEAAVHRQAAQQYQTLDSALAPYKAIMRGAPAEYLPRVMATVSALQVGTPADKARTVVQLMREFAVPAEEMVRVLDGAEPAQAQQPAPYRDQRLDQLLAVAAQRQQYQQQQQRAQVVQTLDQFEAQAEFIAEPGMRETMAALLGGGAAKDLPDAYDKACQLNPDVRTIIERRKAEEAQRTQTQQVQQARYAAGSVRSEPAPPAGSRRPTMEEALYAAIHGGR